MNTDKVMKLLCLIDAEAYGRNRRTRIINYTRRIRLGNQQVQQKKT